jgi:lipoate-protein ligase A
MNYGASPAIVMGPSGSIDEVEAALPVIQRFSGGGTVVVDEDTLFFSLVVQNSCLPCRAEPVALMEWMARLVAPAFRPYTMALKEHDFTIDDKKIGGNAQSFGMDRCVHHTSFLWSWSPERMGLLKVPSKQPAYRKQRGHEAFCHKLSEYFCSKQELAHALAQCLESRFSCRKASLQEACAIMEKPHRKTTKFLLIPELIP